MKDGNKIRVLRELQVIPGVGEKTSEDLWELGIRSVKDLKGKDPEELYLKLCDNAGMKIDKCMLYVFRCAVYYASNEEHDQQLLKWWNWKDKK